MIMSKMGNFLINLIPIQKERDYILRKVKNTKNRGTNAKRLTTEKLFGHE